MWAGSLQGEKAIAQLNAAFGGGAIVMGVGAVVTF